MKRMNLDSVLVKPAGPDCNMACFYCFYLEKTKLFPHEKQHRMSDLVLKEMIRQVMNQSGRQVSFGWQGGEPTLMGLEFFKKAVKYQQQFGMGKTVGNGLQTNGLLIDEQWVEFLKNYNFLIGLSLDGPEHIHDRYRRKLNGSGSWAKVFKKAKLMLKADVAVNALSVVNDYSVDFPEEIYTFLKDLGLNYMQFIPCIETDTESHTQVAPFSVSPQKLGEFWCRIFDLWLGDFKEGVAETSVRFFDSVFFTYVDLPPPECTLLKTCGVYVVVEHNGDVYSCDFFVEPEWKLGNVMHGRLVDMLNSALQRQFGKRKAELPEECRHCRWLRFCRGGCVKDRIRDPRDEGQNHFCLSYKIFFEHAHEPFKRLAEEWKMKQAPRMDLRKQEENPGRNDPCPCGSGSKHKKCCLNHS